MKQTCITLFFSLLAISFVFGQKSYSIYEANKSMGKSIENGLTMNLANVDIDAVEDEWKKFTKSLKGKKTKKNKKTNSWFTDNAKIPDVSDNTIDLYAAFETGRDGKSTSATFWFDLGGAYLSSYDHKDRYPAAERMMEKFGMTVDKRIAKDNLDLQEQNLKTFEKELKDLEKDSEKYQKEIEKARELIAEMEKTLELNVQEQAKKTMEINTQEKAVEEAKKAVKKF